MRFTHPLSAGIAALTFATSAQAAIILDGAYDSDYGAAKSTVAYNPAAPEANFAAPTNQSDTTAYSIYLVDQGGALHGFLQATTTTGLAFANLYFDLDPANGNGSDLGFEINNTRAFVPGLPGYAATPGLQFVVSADGKGIEFLIPNSYFTSAIPGLTYYPAQEFPASGVTVTLRLSQSFGYSVAGGASYGADRLGSVVLAGPVAVPEPSIVATLLFGVAGLALSRRPKGRASK